MLAVVVGEGGITKDSGTPGTSSFEAPSVVPATSLVPVVCVFVCVRARACVCVCTLCIHRCLYCPRCIHSHFYIALVDGFGRGLRMHMGLIVGMSRRN